MEQARKLRLIFFFFLTLTTLGTANPPPIKQTNLKRFTLSDFAKSSNKELEKHFQLDFNWKEKLGFWLIRRKLRKAIKKNPELGKVVFKRETLQQILDAKESPKKLEIWGLIGLSLTVIGIGILGFFFAAAGGVGLISGTLTIGAGTILSKWSLHKHRNEAEKYKSKWIASLGFVIGGLALLGIYFWMIRAILAVALLSA